MKRGKLTGGGGGASWRRPVMRSAIGGRRHGLGGTRATTGRRACEEVRRITEGVGVVLVEVTVGIVRQPGGVNMVAAPSGERRDRRNKVNGKLLSVVYIPRALVKVRGINRDQCPL